MEIKHIITSCCDQICYKLYTFFIREVNKLIVNRFSFSSCHKKSASCDINSILSQFADFLQTFFRGSLTEEGATASCYVDFYRLNIAADQNGM